MGDGLSPWQGGLNPMPISSHHVPVGHQELSPPAVPPLRGPLGARSQEEEETEVWKETTHIFSSNLKLGKAAEEMPSGPRGDLAAVKNAASSLPNWVIILPVKAVGSE